MKRQSPVSILAASLAALASLLTGARAADWLGHGGNPQHTAISPVPAASLSAIRWSTTVDQNNPPEPILIHYGSPSITQENTVIVPVRQVGGGFRVEARSGETGSLLWQQSTSFVTAPSNGGWVPSFSPTLTPAGQLYYPGPGGTIFRVDNPNATTVAPVQMSFLPDYAANTSSYNSSVFVSTPLTSDSTGNIYFGYQALGAPGGLTSGIARIAPNGSATYTSINAASGIAGATNLRIGTNSAPALSNDGSKIYIGINGPSTDYLAAIDSTTLAPLHRTALFGVINDSATSSPTVAPDGHVYFGTLPGYNFRGHLERFSGDLSQSFTRGSFGWDETVSIVPSTMVPSYTGSSSYLVFSKYNNYKSAGGDGVNKIAILDPNDTQFDSLAGGLVMKEVMSIAGVTSDADASHPNAVTEWCINTATVDPATFSILVNNEDGYFYRWDLRTNSLSEVIQLQSDGALEAYTPTAVGPDGAVYAINRSRLFSVIPEPGSALLLCAGSLIAAQSRRRRTPRHSSAR